MLTGTLPGEDDENDALTYSLIGPVDAATDIGTLTVDASGAYEYTIDRKNKEKPVARFQYRVSQTDDPSQSAIGTFEVRLSLGQDRLAVQGLPK